MDQEDSKVQDVEVRENDTPAPGLALDNLAAIKHGKRTRSTGPSGQDLVASDTSRQRVGPALQPVAEVVDMASDAPPAGSDKTRTGLGLEVGEVLDARVLGVATEVVLLRVGQAEDAVTSSQDSADGNQTKGTELLRMSGQVAGLSRVHEGHPDNVAEAEHESEAVGGDVHGCQNGRLHVDAIENVKGLNGGDEEDRIGHVAEGAVLLGDKGAIEDDPAEKTGAHLHELLDVDFANEGESNAGVQFATNVEIVDERASGAAGCQLAHLLVAGLDLEAADVDEDGEREGEEDVG